MKLLDKLNLREEIYENHTTDIIGDVANLIVASERLLDGYITQNLQWVDVLMMDESLMIVGATYYTTETGEEVEDVIRVSVPFELAEKGTVDELISFIQEQSAPMPELKEYKNDDDDQTFDIDELSEDQQKQLSLHSPAKHPGLKH